MLKATNDCGTVHPQQNKNYDSACSRLREELPFVKEAAMPKIIDIFKWSHHAKYGSVKAINSKMHARSMKSLKDERNVINIEQVTSILAEYSLEVRSEPIPQHATTTTQSVHSCSGFSFLGCR